MIKREIPSELLFRFSADGDSYKVTGAHYKTLTFIELDGEQFGHKESDALDISLADPDAIEAALGALNTALVVEIGQQRAQIQMLGDELTTERERLAVANDEVARLNALLEELQMQIALAATTD